MFQGLVLLVDDEPIAAEDSMAALKQFVRPEQILYASSADEAIRLLDSRPVALVFLDIEMPEESGFFIAAYLDDHWPDVPYVFLTGHADFALESYDYEPVDYLIKPVDLSRLARTFERLEDRREQRPSGKVAVRFGQEYDLVDPQKIAYICKEKRKIWIRMKDGSEYQTTSSLEELDKIFEDYGFFRCHQSFLIPIADVERVSTGRFGQTYEATLQNVTVSPVSRGKYGLLREKLETLGIPFVRGTASSEREEKR